MNAATWPCCPAALKASWPPAISQNHTRYNGSVTVLLNEMERSGK